MVIFPTSVVLARDVEMDRVSAVIEPVPQLEYDSALATI
jgi:hypothetical protein